MKRDTTEITRQIYESQKMDCIKGDFYQLVSKDAKSVEIDINEKEMAEFQKAHLKSS